MERSKEMAEAINTLMDSEYQALIVKVEEYISELESKIEWLESGGRDCRSCEHVGFDDKLKNYYCNYYKEKHNCGGIPD